MPVSPLNRLLSRAVFEFYPGSPICKFVIDLRVPGGNLDGVHVHMYRTSHFARLCPRLPTDHAVGAVEHGGLLESWAHGLKSPDSSLIYDTYFIGTSQTVIAGIVSLSINNTISIDPSHGAKPNEPSWTLFPIPPTTTQTMHLWEFRKKIGFSILFMCNWITENETR